MDFRPPEWADRFLEWYCSPDRLEEIQGDVHELYGQRLERGNKRVARMQFVWDVIRFCRWSNIRRSSWRSSSQGSWRFAFTLAWRHAFRNRLNFGVKIFGIAVSFGYALTLGLIAFDELSFDRHHEFADRIFRIGTTVSFNGNTTHYAVSPLPFAQVLKERIPEIENSFRFMAEEYPLLKKGDDFFNGFGVLAVDSNFLRTLSYDFQQGDDTALDEPDKIVLTESTARKIFGREDPIGQTLVYNNHFNVEVSGVIKDQVHASHLKADVLISWSTFDRNESFTNLNAYTYILVRKGSSITEVTKKMHPALADFEALVAKEYKATFEPIVENVKDIHLSPETDEDVAIKGSLTYVYMMIAIAGLFAILGIVNYVNLTSAELTRDAKKIGLLAIFGGTRWAYKKTVLSEGLLYLFFAGILTLGLVMVNLTLVKNFLGKEIDATLLWSPIFPGTIFLLFTLTLLSVYFNSSLYLRLNVAIHALRGTMHFRKIGLTLRQVLVSVQFSFSMVMIALIMVLVQQFYFLRSKDKGFKDENVMVIKLHPQSVAQADSFREELLRESGISGVASSSYYPGVIETKYVFEVESDKGLQKRLTPVIFCGADYLDIIGAQITHGRKLESNRSEDQSASYVINEAAAREFGWKEPLGKRITGPGISDDRRRGTVVGVVRDFNFASLYSRIDPLIVILEGGNTFLYVKMVGGDVAKLVSSIGSVYKKQWPDFPFEWEFLDAKYKSLYKRDQDSQYLFQIGMVISVLMSCLGVFSISALMANLQQKEAGIRKVVGASSLQLFWLHVRSFAKLLIVAVLVAWPVIGYLSTYWLNSFAYRIELGSVYYLLPAALALLMVGATAGYHGIRAARINPVEILKCE